MWCSVKVWTSALLSICVGFAHRQRLHKTEVCFSEAQPLTKTQIPQTDVSVRRAQALTCALQGFSCKKGAHGIHFPICGQLLCHWLMAVLLPHKRHRVHQGELRIDCGLPSQIHFTGFEHHMLVCSNNVKRVHGSTHSQSS